MEGLLEAEAYADQTAMLAKVTLEVGIAILDLAVDRSSNVNFETTANAETFDRATSNLAPIGVTNLAVSKNVVIDDIAKTRSDADITTIKNVIYGCFYTGNYLAELQVVTNTNAICDIGRINAGSHVIGTSRDFNARAGKVAGHVFA